MRTHLSKIQRKVKKFVELKPLKIFLFTTKELVNLLLCELSKLVRYIILDNNSMFKAEL